MSEARVLVRAASRVGEGPVWDSAAGMLRWVDILAGELHTTDPESGATTSITVPTLVGAAAPRARGGLVLATREGFATLDGEAFTPRLQVLPDGHRMNDAACDPRGRYWAGSTDLAFAANEGRLHVLDSDWQSRIILEDLSLPNGMGWSPDGSTYYLVDTTAGEILVFDVDVETGLPGGRRLFTAIDPSRGMPDGMTVDTAGCLWVALWGGAAVIRLAPDGSELSVVRLPVVQPSACAFGGPQLDRLFITSARDGLNLVDDDLDGSLFVIDDPGVAGLPATPFGG